MLTDSQEYGAAQAALLPNKALKLTRLTLHSLAWGVRLHSHEATESNSGASALIVSIGFNWYPKHTVLLPR